MCEIGRHQDSHSDKIIRNNTFGNSFSNTENFIYTNFMTNFLLVLFLSTFATAFSDFSNVKWMHGTNGQFLLPLLHRTNYSILSFGQLMKKARIAPYGGETFANNGATMVVGTSNFFISVSNPSEDSYFDPLGYSLCSFTGSANLQNETEMYNFLVEGYKKQIKVFKNYHSKIPSSGDFPNFGMSTIDLNSKLSGYGATIHNSQLLKQWDMKWWNEVKDIERPPVLRAVTREDFLNALICIFEKQGGAIPRIFKLCGIHNGNSDEKDIDYFDKWKYFDFDNKSPGYVILYTLRLHPVISKVKTIGTVWQATSETKSGILQDVYILFNLRNGGIESINGLNQTVANILLKSFEVILKDMKEDVEKTYEEYRNIGKSRPFISLNEKEKKEMLEGPFPIIIGSTMRDIDYMPSQHGNLISPIRSDEWDLIMTNEKNLDRLNKWLQDNKLTDKKVATLEELVLWRRNTKNFDSAVAKCGLAYAHLGDYLNLEFPKIDSDFVPI